MPSIYERYYQLVKKSQREAKISFKLTDYELTRIKGKWRAREKASKKFAPKYVTDRLKKKTFGKRRKKVVLPVMRVTVGTGLSVEGRNGRPSRFSFTWSKVVLRVDAAQAVLDGTAWIRDHAFGAACKRLGFSPKYGREWGLEDMDNFPGFNVEDDGAADFRDLLKASKVVKYNGSEVDV